jgi:hypothetical protein
MSDYMEYAEYYKKAWEKSLSERTSELQAENDRFRKALQEIACLDSADELNYLDEPHSAKVARKALKGGE